MASLDAYIAELKQFGNNLKQNVIKISKQQEEDILNIVRRRLKETGQDANLSFIGPPPYSPFTIEDKKRKGDEAGHFTLFDTGSFHDKMFIEVQGGLIMIDSRDGKTGDLINRYGRAILGLTEQETKFVTEQLIEPKLQNMINDLPNVNIKL